MTQSKKRSPKVNYKKQTLTQLLQELEIEEDSWDLLIVGDGSGSSWVNPCGWGAVALERDTETRHTFFGGMNCGTVNVAELMPYVQSLSWYLDRLRKRKDRDPKIVHIVTDSEYSASAGEKSNKLNNKKNFIFWAVIALAERRGLDIRWHWIPRESQALNQYSDKLSRLARLAITELQAEIQKPDAVDSLGKPLGKADDHNTNKQEATDEQSTDLP